MTGRKDNYRVRDHYWPALAAVLAWGGMVAAAAFLPQQRLWGVNHLAFAGSVVRWGFAVALLLAVIYVAGPGALAGRFLALRGRVMAWLSGWRGATALAIAVGAAGWLLRAREAFLGDGTLRADGANEGAALAPPEMLPSFLTATLVRYAPPAWGIDGYNAYRILSVAFAVLLALGLWWLVPKVVSSGKRTPIFWLLTFGSVRLLAGYIESYMPAFAALVLWTLAVLAYRRDRLGAGWVMALWAVAMVSHVMSIVLIPATLWLFAAGPSERPGVRRGALAQFAMVALIIGGTVLGVFLKFEVAGLGVKGSHFVLPLFSGAPHNYGIISFPHLIDFANHWLLLAPAFLLAIVVAFLTTCSSMIPRVPKWSGGRAWNSEAMLWGLAAGFPLLASVVIEPQLGWGRDWDLFCMLSAPALVGMALWLAENPTGAVRRAAGAIAVLSAGLWLVFSVDANAERRRFEALLDLDPTRAGYGHEIMAQYYRRRDDERSALEHYQKALLAGENLRYRLCVAVSYFYLGRFDESERWYRGVLARDSTLAPAWHGLSLALEREGRFGEARDCALRALTLNPAELDYQYQAGALELELAEYAKAVAYLEPLARVQPLRSNRLNALGLCYLGLQRLPEAQAVLDEAVRIDPDNPVLNLNAARVAMARQNFAAARQLLSRYEQLTPPGERHPEARKLADSLARAGP